MAGIRIKPATPASGSVTVTVVPVPNSRTTSSAGADPFDRRQWRRKGDVDLDPRGHRGYRLGRRQRVLHEHRFWRLGGLCDMRARCAAVAEGHIGRMKRRGGLARVAGSAPRGGRGRHVVADRCLGYRRRPHCRLTLRGEALDREKLRGIAACRAEIHLRRIEIRLRVLVDARNRADVVDDVSDEVRRGALPHSRPARWSRSVRSVVV